MKKNTHYLFFFTLFCSMQLARPEIMKTHFPAYIPKDITYLLYMDLNNGFPGFINDQWIGMKNNCPTTFANRVYSHENITQEDIWDAKKYYGSIPFSWWVQEKQKKQLVPLLEANGFHLKVSYPLMICDITKLTESSYNPAIQIREAQKPEEKSLWIKIVAESYAMKLEEFAIFANYLFDTADSKHMHLYLGYVNESPAGACMIVDHAETVSVHLVATLPEFRGKGLGYAINHHALILAKNRGANRAVLAASAMGKPVYEKLGFKEIENLHVYVQ